MADYLLGRLLYPAGPSTAAAVEWEGTMAALASAKAHDRCAFRLLAYSTLTGSVRSARARTIFQSGNETDSVGMAGDGEGSNLGFSRRPAQSAKPLARDSDVENEALAAPLPANESRST